MADKINIKKQYIKNIFIYLMLSDIMKQPEFEKRRKEIMGKNITMCKTCGKDIAANAKVCPACGAKNKKPLFKRWWFWVIVICVAIGAMPSGGEESVTVEDVTTEATQEAMDLNTQPEVPTMETQEQTKSDLTMGQLNALGSAESYLAFSAFSYEGLISQLEFEGYTSEDAAFAADRCGADWNEQALKAAENYLSFSAFSYEGLIDQLEFEKYTSEQAVYAVDHCGADWFEQAVKAAESYLDFSSFSKEGLIDQLEFEGYTHEQAVYAVEQNGY